MTTLAHPPPSGPESNGIPLLLPGDHLDRATFHARYLEMPESVRAELVGGVVYMSPLYVPHARARSHVITWLGNYMTATPGVEVLDNVSIALAEDGEPQPDACLIITPERGGQTRQDEEGLLVGAPELIVEVAYSSAAYDLHSKWRDYERAGVLEYVIVVLQEPAVVWLAREGDSFRELQPDADGLLKSSRFPGLWLDPAALLRRDTRAVRDALDLGLKSVEHADFARRLSP